MTIRPVDMQLLVPKIQEAGKVQNQQQNSPQTSQQDLAVQMQKQADIREKSVQQTDHSAEGKIQAHQEKQGQGKQDTSGREKNKKNDLEQSDKNLDPMRGNVLDIKI